MALLADARIAIWQGGSLWVVQRVAPIERARTEPHAHHAIQISFAIEGAIRFWAGDLCLDDAIVAIAPDAQHVFAGTGAAGHLFIDPESRSGRTVAARFLQGRSLAVLPPETLRAFLDPVLAAFRAGDDAGLIGSGRAIVERLTGGVVADAPDWRVRQLMAAAAERLDQPVSLADFAGVGGISASRLRHLFVEQTGLPFRTYLLWLRLTRAVQALAAGAPHTAAAHEAGFADSAHFSRTFKRMFGVPPTALRMT